MKHPFLIGWTVFLLSSLAGGQDGPILYGEDTNSRMEIRQHEIRRFPLSTTKHHCEVNGGAVDCSEIPATLEDIRQAEGRIAALEESDKERARRIELLSEAEKILHQLYDIQAARLTEAEAKVRALEARLKEQQDKSASNFMLPLGESSRFCPRGYHQRWFSDTGSYRTDIHIPSGLALASVCVREDLQPSPALR